MSGNVTTLVVVGTAALAVTIYMIYSNSPGAPAFKYTRNVDGPGGRKPCDKPLVGSGDCTCMYSDPKDPSYNVTTACAGEPAFSVFNWDGTVTKGHGGEGRADLSDAEKQTYDKQPQNFDFKPSFGICNILNKTKPGFCDARDAPPGGWSQTCKKGDPDCNCFFPSPADPTYFIPMKCNGADKATYFLWDGSKRKADPTTWDAAKEQFLYTQGVTVDADGHSTKPKDPAVAAKVKPKDPMAGLSGVAIMGGNGPQYKDAKTAAFGARFGACAHLPQGYCDTYDKPPGGLSQACKKGEPGCSCFFPSSLDPTYFVPMKCGDQKPGTVFLQDGGKMANDAAAWDRIDEQFLYAHGVMTDGSGHSTKLSVRDQHP